MPAHLVTLLNDLHRRSLRMASRVEDIVHEACECVFDMNDEQAERVMQRDEEVDTAEVEVEQEVIRLLALYQPVGVDLRQLCTILKVNNDLERIADGAVNIAERAKAGDLQRVARLFSELRQMCPAVRRALRRAVQAYSASDAEIARQVRAEDQAVDALHAQIIRGVVASADHTPATIPGYLDVLTVAKNLERIADHATNIAEDVIFLSTGEIVRHSPRDGTDTRPPE
jgi:phosphate transport system protein